MPFEKFLSIVGILLILPCILAFCDHEDRSSSESAIYRSHEGDYGYLKIIENKATLSSIREAVKAAANKEASFLESLGDCLRSSPLGLKPIKFGSKIIFDGHLVIEDSKKHVVYVIEAKTGFTKIFELDKFRLGRGELWIGIFKAPKGEDKLFIYSANAGGEVKGNFIGDHELGQPIAGESKYLSDGGSFLVRYKNDPVLNEFYLSDRQGKRQFQFHFGPKPKMDAILAGTANGVPITKLFSFRGIDQRENH